MNKLSLIIKREFFAKVRNKSFIVMTFLSPLLFVGMGVLIAFLTNMNNDKINKIAIHDSSGLLKNSFKSDKKNVYIDLSNLPINVAKDTANASYEGMIFIPKVSNIQELKDKVEYVSEESASIEFIGKIEKVVDSVLTQEKLKNSGIDTQKIKEATVESKLKLSKFSGEESLKGLNEIKIAIGGMFGYLIMMFIIIYGNFVMRSVIEEKTNRIIEIIISSVKPFQLMMGKIIGTSLAGILQFLIWAILGGVFFFVISQQFGVEVGNQAAVGEMASKAKEMSDFQSYLLEIQNLPLMSMVICFIIYFIGGYFLYSSFYAAIGAAVDSETDSQQFLLPIIMPLMLGVYIGFFTVVSEPHGTISTVFSIIPLTSPIVMLMRIPFGVPLWQLILSIVLLFTTFLFVVYGASKIYRVGILMHGKKPTWKELVKWMKY